VRHDLKRVDGQEIVGIDRKDVVAGRSLEPSAVSPCDAAVDRVPDDPGAPGALRLFEPSASLSSVEPSSTMMSSTLL
jgi:hypothetical protein